MPMIVCLITMILMNHIQLITTPLYFMPFVFGLVIGLFNFRFYIRKIFFYKPAQAIIVSVLLSYICFFMVLFSYLVLTFFMNFSPINKESSSRMALFITIYFVTPLILLISYGYIFSYPKTKLTIIFSLIFLIVFLLIGYDYYYLKYFFNDNFKNLPIRLWLPLMTLVFQLILYQKELKTWVKARSGTLI